MDLYNEKGFRHEIAEGISPRAFKRLGLPSG